MAFKVVSIKQKTTWRMFLVSMVVLLLASLLFAVVEVRHYYSDVEGDLRALANIMVANAQQPLAIKDFPSAVKLVSSLEADPHITNAYFLLPDGQVVAAYFRSARSGKRINTVHDMEMMRLEERQIEEGLRFGIEKLWQEKKQLSLFIPIHYAGSHVGYLYLRAELSSLYVQLLYLALGWLIIFGVAVVLSYLLSLRLHLFISKPVDQLVKQMQHVASEKKLDGLVSQAPLDEFELLYRGFDEMLNALRVRDVLLEGQRHGLESEVKERTKELERAKFLAEQATEAKSRFLANMSHEIRTPMIGVLGMADLLRQSELTAKDRRLADTIYQSGEALLNILNDILDLSKIEAGRLELCLAPFNLARVMRDVVSLLQVKAREKDLQLSCEVPADLPVEVLGDAGRLRQVLLNLIGNAVKFTQRGYVKITLAGSESVSTRVREYRIVIEDTGIGISEKDQARIFKAFNQGELSLEQAPGGTGLGLAIVHELVALMGGEALVESTIGKGSRFTVVLPLENVEPQPGHILEEAAEKNWVKPEPFPETLALENVSGRRVLLAEDNTTTQELLMILFHGAGIELSIVVNGREAVEFLSRNQVDLVFMDCQMPEMDGFEATRYLRQTGFTTPIIALTAYAHAEDHRRCIDAGMNDFLCKPFRQKDLKNILCKWLEDQPAASLADAGTTTGS